MAFSLDTVRRQVRMAAQWLSIALETSGETQARILYLPLETTVIKIAVDLNLFNILIENDCAPKTIEELVHATDADSVLLTRILRSLAAIGAVKQNRSNSFAATNISKTFTQASLSDGSRFCFDIVGRAWQCLPEFLQRTGYKNPTDFRDCAINIAFQTDESGFEILVKNTEQLKAFNSYMTGQRQGRANWLDFYPFEQQLVNDLSDDENAVLLVDVGGGFGHEIHEIKRKYPAIPGRMILQDLPETVSQLSAASSTEIMAHDFFAAQPIRGARAYYFRNVFHDWPDTKCWEILRHTASVMKKGYSKVLINEWCLLDQGSSVFATFSDLNMMAACAGMERTETQWRELLSSSGLRVTKIWSVSQDAESLLEAVLE